MINERLHNASMLLLVHIYLQYGTELLDLILTNSEFKPQNPEKTGKLFQGHFPSLEVRFSQSD